MTPFARPEWPDPDDWAQPQEEAARAALNSIYLQLHRTSHMNVDELYPSKWLRAADLKGQRVTATISSVDLETFQDGTSKPILSFQGKEKGLVLNKTNGLAIADVYGKNTDGWIGKPIELFSMKVQGPNGLVDGIRITVPQAAAPAPVAGTDASVADDFDDGIPF